MTPTTVLLLLVGAGVVAALFLALWLSTLGRLRRLRADRTGSDATVAQLRLIAAEHGGRLRIIRELHELALHRVSTMVAQAEGARYAGEQDPGAGLRATASIARTGRDTLADMRRITTLVRESGTDAGPQPTLRSTRDLFRVLRDGGLDVRFEETGEPYDLNAGAELAVYRILQEALTNCLTYGGEGTTARVVFAWTPQGLSVRVEDDGLRTAVLRRSSSPEQAEAELGYTVEDDLRSLTQTVAGNGITEMRQRTELFGGTLTATEVPGVGFSIAANFPSIRHHNGVHGVDLTRR